MSNYGIQNLGAHFMNKYAIFFLFILLLNSFALQASFITEDQERLCKVYQESATLIMQYRQNNIHMSHVLSLVGDHRVARSIVLDAYNAPVHPTADQKIREVHEFAFLVYTYCTATIGDDDWWY